MPYVGILVPLAARSEVDRRDPELGVDVDVDVEETG